MRVSIVINNYNYARFVGQAIESALAQSYPDTEVIVVDDGSTDGSRGVIEGYAPSVRAIYKANGGQASAIDAGFEACGGEVVIFLDADDVLVGDAVGRVVEVFEGDPSVAKVQWRLEEVDAQGMPVGRLRPSGGELPAGDVREELLATGTYLSSPTSGNAFPSWVLREILPMDEGRWRISADGYLVNLAPFFGDVGAIDEVLGLYRVHGKNNWSMEGLDLGKIRAYLAHDIQKQELLKEFGRRSGLRVDDELALRTPAHVKFRLASLRLDPQGHPYGDDRVRSLVAKGIRGCWRNPSFSRRKKLLYSAWFVAAGLAPPRLSGGLLSSGLLPSRRRRFFKAVAGRG